MEHLNSSFRELLKQHSQKVPDGILIDIANASTDDGMTLMLVCWLLWEYLFCRGSSTGALATYENVIN